MNKKFAIVGILLVFVLSLMVGAVSAQQGGGGGRGGDNRPPMGDDLRDVVQLVADATGLDPQDLMQQLRDGAILADLITANGGDVNTVIAEALALVTEKTNQAVTDGKITQERADEILANAETRLTDLVNNPVQLGGENRPQLGGEIREVIDLVAEQTGLDAQELLQQLRDGATLADIITENGGDVDGIIAILIGLITEKTNQAVTDGKITQERADEILANAETRTTNLFNNPIPQDGRGNRPQFEGVFIDALIESGLTHEEIRAQLEGGATLRQVLTDASLDVDALTAEVLANAQTRLDEQVANDEISAEDAATRLVELETRINELLDATRPARPARQQDV